MLRRALLSTAVTATSLLTIGLGIGYDPVLLQAHTTTSPLLTPGRPDADDVDRGDRDRDVRSARDQTDRYHGDRYHGDRYHVDRYPGGSRFSRPSVGLLPPTLPPGSGLPGGSRLVDPVMVGPLEIFVADYETGDFSQWGHCQSAVLNGDCTEVDGSHRSMQIVEDPDMHRGRYAARFAVHKGDIPEFGGGERSEVAAGDDEQADTREGDERWYEWSMRFPENFENPTGNWFIVMQWHAGEGGSPPLTINISDDGTVDIAGDGTDEPEQTIGPVRRGEWTDYVLHAKFSADHDTGFVEAWENGEQTVPKTARQTMTSDNNDLKMGIYRDEDAGDGPAEVLFSGLRVTGPAQGGGGRRDDRS